MLAASPPLTALLAGHPAIRPLARLLALCLVLTPVLATATPSHAVHTHARSCTCSRSPPGALLTTLLAYVCLPSCVLIHLCSPMLAALSLCLARTVADGVSAAVCSGRGFSVGLALRITSAWPSSRTAEKPATRPPTLPNTPPPVHCPQTSCSAVTAHSPTLVFARPLTSGRALAHSRAALPSTHKLHSPRRRTISTCPPWHTSSPTRVPASTHTPLRSTPSTLLLPYHYAPATPANTPTKAHPSSSYPYRQASNPSHSRLASAPQAS
ncbi:hypothetical protein FRC08_010177, partial [Ceratobasidium sp. 394]